jgi:hypothetical protein
MEKFLIIIFLVGFGLFITEIDAQQQNIPQQREEQLKVDVKEDDLPEEVSERLESDFSGWSFLHAYRIMGQYPGAESPARHYFMIEIEKEGETKTVNIAEDGELLNDLGETDEPADGGANERQKEGYRE